VKENASMKKQVFLCTLALAGLVSAANAQYMKQGAMKATVIVVGEDRIVVQPLEGGQVAIQAGMKKEGDEYRPIAEHIEFFQTLKPGDKLLIGWGQDHTNHFYWREGRKVESFDEPTEKPAEGHPEQSPVQQQVNALKSEIAGLRAEIAELKELIQRLVEKQK